MGFELTEHELEMIEKEEKALQKAPKVLFYTKLTEQGWKVTCTPQIGQQGFVSFWRADMACCEMEGNLAGAEYALAMNNTSKKPAFPEGYMMPVR